jgi:hypothetical protein
MGKLGGEILGIRRTRAHVVVAALLTAVFACLALAGVAGAAKDKDKGGKYEGPKIPTPDSSRCDFLDTSVCLQPFPNNMYLKKDSSTATGYRVNFDPASMPVNAAGLAVDPTDWNRNDGFSPGQAITLHVPGLETQAAFQRSKIVSLKKPQRYDNPSQAVVVFDAKTGERHPIFAEMDANAADDSDRNLIIRPLRNWEESTRYVVALRRLKTESGEKIKAPKAFKVYRDRLKTKQKPIESRRSYFEKRVFKAIKKSGTVHRPGLYMAWDFTTASADNIAGRALAMRDDAFAKLGDTNLADGVVQGSSPDFAVTEVNENPEPGMLREVKGTVKVPCYLDENGCPPGSQFAYSGPEDTDPDWNASFTVDAPFECNIPENVDAGSSVAPARPALYGHGLLGTRGQAGSGYIDDFAQAHNVAHCAVDWAGFSEDDVLPVILPALTDVAVLSKAFDRMQQGFINFMYLGRAMIHPDGLTSHPAFQFDAGSGLEPVLDTSELYYYGNSQGGIMGGALTALAPDFEQSVLGVPGMNYSTLLRRSVDFDDYAKLPGAGLYANYPDEGERVLLLGLMQMLWDRGEANGYAHHMTDDPYENTPTHDVLMHLALGDHQVANMTAEVQARTIGASALGPNPLDAGRYWQADPPFFQIPFIDGFPEQDSAMVYWDGGPVGFTGVEGEGTAVPPLENIAPREPEGFGADPHSYPRWDPYAQEQMSNWLRPGAQGAVTEPCPTGPCYANGWTGP